MGVKDWIKSAELAGWQVVSVKRLTIQLKCCKQGCPGAHVLPLDNLGQSLAPCDLPHNGPYSTRVYDQYVTLVGEFRRRRRSLGLSQEDISAAGGFTDGYINKLEALDRKAAVPTLQLWAQTLGLRIALQPAPLPAATLRAIEYRAKTPYRAEMARFKPQQASLFNE